MSLETYSTTTVLTIAQRQMSMWTQSNVNKTSEEFEVTSGLSVPVQLDMVFRSNLAL